MEIDTRRWKHYEGKEREIMRQCEWFRTALEHHCREGGRGTQSDLSREVGYAHPSMVSWLVKGLRTPDFKQAVSIAYYFGTDLISFLEEGRQLSERPYQKRRSVDRFASGKWIDANDILRPGGRGAKKGA
jgi:transcriptional regulator with XRE-family HTH domain